MKAAILTNNIETFQKLYKERFGIELTTEEAHEKGLQVLRLVSAIYRPMCVADNQKVTARKVELLKK